MDELLNAFKAKGLSNCVQYRSRYFKKLLEFFCSIIEHIASREQLMLGLTGFNKENGWLIGAATPESERKRPVHIKFHVFDTELSRKREVRLI
ncbi:MAG: hypothetical protein ACOC41_00910 [Chitinivibrionales bacterium]